MGFFDGLISQATAEPLKAVQSIGSVVTPLVGAAGSFLGQTSANNANAQLMELGNAFNAAEAEKDRAFQTHQRETQYQTAVKDLMAAGLNPMLAYTQGGAKPTSGAQAASTAPPRMENALGNAANSAATSAMALNNVMQNRLIEAQIVKTDTESDNIQADTVNKLDTNPNIKAEYKRILSDLALKDTASQLNSAMELNQRNNIAPSVDPYWYRDLKRIGKSASSAFGIKF